MQKEKPTVLFSNIACGEIFYYELTLYMRVFPDPNINSVHLSDGRVTFFEDFTEVKRVTYDQIIVTVLP